MTITSKVTEEREIEIELPYFCKHGEQFFIKVINDEQSIRVHTYNFQIGVEIISNDILKRTIVMSTPCTEEEFNAAYYKAYSVLYKYYEEGTICSL